VIIETNGEFDMFTHEKIALIKTRNDAEPQDDVTFLLELVSGLNAEIDRLETNGEFNRTA